MKDQILDKSGLLSALKMKCIWTSGSGAQRKAQAGDGDWGGFRHNWGCRACGSFSGDGDSKE